MSSPSPPKIWSFENPFSDPKSTEELIEEASKEDANSWKIVLEERLSVHKDRCERWKAEIENLLVFAGLFSAVVTTFVVDSYKNIDPDPQDTAVVLLAQLVSQLAPGRNNSISTAPISPSTPDQSQVRVNALWFLSLVLALGTAVGGITVLQWIRSFQQYDRNLTYKQSFALASLRDQSLDNWKVSAFIATLPFLLQLALVLFLIGLSDFLWNTVSHSVAIPCIAASVIIITFLVASIMLPTMQYFLLWIGVFKRNVPAPCPYRSPPAWAFLRVTQWIGAISGLRQIIRRFSKMRMADAKARWRRGPAQRFLSFKQDAHRDQHGTEEDSLTLEWIQPDLNWLSARSQSHGPSPSPLPTARQDADGQSPPTRQEDHDDYSGAYDAANGLSSMQDYTFRSSATPYVLYNCFRDLPSHLVKDASLWRDALSDVDGDPLVKVEMLYNDFGGKFRMLSEAEDDIVFLEWLEQTKKMRLGKGIAERQLEIYVRLLGTIFHVSPASPSLKVSPSNSNKWMWVPTTLSDVQTDPLSSFEVGGVINEQLLLIFERFITSLRAHDPLAPLGRYHTPGQIDSLGHTAVVIILKWAINMSSAPSMRWAPLTEHEGHVIETLGVRINDSIKSFLIGDELKIAKDSDGFTDGRCPALYYLSFVYVVHLSRSASDQEYPPTRLLASAPKLGQSLIDLMNTWLSVAEGIGFTRLEEFGIGFSTRATHLKSWLGDATTGSRIDGPGPEGAESSTRPTSQKKPERRPTLISSAVDRFLGRKGENEVDQAKGPSTGDPTDAV